MTFDVVIPTIGRGSLRRLLRALEEASGPRPGRILVVDDGAALTTLAGVEVLRGRRAGPAAARNVGWRASEADWVAFLDDDVVPTADWLERLARDLLALPGDVAGSQGRVHVPLPTGRKPTDWERNVRGLETAAWATADMAFRRSALAAAGGFDERFPRAFREDADLALRLLGRGHRLVRGSRGVVHPVRRAGPLESVRLQAGNADDALMARLHGRAWRERAGAPRGRRRFHLAVSAAGLLGLAGALTRRRAPALTGAAAWALGTAELAWRRVAPGPRTPREVAAMLLTSTLVPPAATWHWLAGHVRHRRVRGQGPVSLPDAVLLDRDGTLVLDVPYNGEPGRVVPVPGARAALDRLRAAGIPLAVVSNQSGVGRGLVTLDQVGAVNRRIEELLGPFASWALCPHGPAERCACRKPEPGLLVRAARELGVDPARCVVIGDVGADVAAARAAGARAILVPTPATRRAEVRTAPEVVATLSAAVDRVLGAA